jgi:hypothetical protein
VKAGQVAGLLGGGACRVDVTPGVHKCAGSKRQARAEIARPGAGRGRADLGAPGRASADVRSLAQPRLQSAPREKRGIPAGAARW